jgi:hypothetical protein
LEKELRATTEKFETETWGFHFSASNLSVNGLALPVGESSATPKNFVGGFGRQRA